MFYQENAPEGLEFRNLDTLFGYTIKTGETVISNDPTTDPRGGGLPKGHPDMNSYLGVPFFGSSGLIGMFGIANKPNGYDKALVTELDTLTNLISSLIESSRNNSIIKNMAQKDALTGAFNRFYFHNYINEIFRKQKKNQSKIALLWIDLDDFKKVNDTHGHQVGDAMLKTLVARLKKNLYNNDLVARIGGDEFIVALENVNHYTDAGKIAERLLQAFKKPMKIENHEIKIGFSIGISCYTDSITSAEKLVRNADLALYKAKMDKGKYHYFSETIQTEFETQKIL